MNKIKEFISLILDLILPKDPEIIEIENLSESEIFDIIPQANEINDSKFKALFQHKNKISKRAIWAIKYSRNQKIIKKFSTIFYEFILENITDEIMFFKFNNPLLVSIPMHNADLVKRGYNQSELIVNEINKIDKNKNFDVENGALIKIKQTQHQSELKNRCQRLKNLNDSFYANPNLVKDRNIILIDDVITTCTTMREAAKTLKNAGAKKVIGFSLTH